MGTSWNEAKKFARCLQSNNDTAVISPGLMGQTLHVLQCCRSQDTGDIRLMSLKSRPWLWIGGQRHSLSVFVSLSIILPCFIPSPNMFIIINDCTKCPALALHISIWHMAVISIQKTCFFLMQKTKHIEPGIHLDWDCQMNENGSMSAWTKF